MKRRSHLTALALLLTLGALAVPCVKWYASGSSETARRAAEIENAPQRLAAETAAQLAGRLHDRLETLRETESRRPFYHYQNLYHDPKGAYEGASVIPSPLAEGPTDPLIQAYFQIDAAGKLTLPTLGEDTVATNSPGDLAIQQRLQSTVPASTCVSAMLRPPAQQGFVNTKTEVLENAAWSQNVQAQQLYRDIKGGKRGLQSVQAGNVAITVGEFSWCTLPLGDGVAPVALRTVNTPAGTLVQGFALSVPAITATLDSARFVPAAPTNETVVTALVAGLDWFVTIDAAQAAAKARARAHDIRTRFMRSFVTSVICAGIAGLCVVGLVWQTERLARQRSEFAAAAAHELRTPLAGLRMYGEMLADGLGDPTRRHDYAQRLADEAARLGRVVSNVLGFTRLERGTLRVQPEPGDLAGVVRDCVARQRPALEAGGARIEWRMDDELPAVKFDRDAVAEIVQNLLDNAEKHTRAATDRTIRVELSRANTGVALSVSDHGAGIPGDVRRQLFRPFTRSRDPDTPAGLGLGLALVRGLARGHGADVTYRDANGGGAVFTVTFPRS